MWSIFPAPPEAITGIPPVSEMGAVSGISTQTMHARGPMGLEELTSSKYIVYGTGQVRE